MLDGFSFEKCQQTEKIYSFQIEKSQEQPLVVTHNATEIWILLDLIQGQESQQENPDPVLQKQ